MTSENINLEENQSLTNNSEQKFSLDSMQRTYTGLLDDVMIRYSNEYLSNDFFNKMIAKNIFFGGGLYINDGYLVNHPIARQYLYDDNSLLRRMLATGFIQVLTRASSSEALALMPETMASQGNESFSKLVKSSEWKDFSPLFNRIAQSVFYNRNARSWPNRNMSVGYTKLMRDRAFTAEPHNLGIANVTFDEWQRIRDDFLDREPEKSGPRDKLEKAALKVLTKTKSDPRIAMNEIMTIGNQAYHYNFGLALTHEDKNGVAVDTTIGAAFDELLQTTTVERGQLDNIPLLRIPKEIPFNRGDLFLDFLDPSTRIGQAKLIYLTNLRRVISGESNDFNSLKTDLRHSTEEYITRIIELLAPQFGHFELKKAFDESFTIAVGSLSDQKTDNNITAIAAPTAGLAIEIQETVNQRGRQFLIERFKLRDVSEEFNPDTEQLIRFGDIRPQIASLAFDKKEAARFIENIPPMF